MAKGWSDLTSEQKGKVVGEGLGTLGSLMDGYAAKKTSFLNAKLSTQYGQEKFESIMGEVKKSVSTYATQTAGSGMVSQNFMDVAMGGATKGAKEAARARREYDVQAANMKYEGRQAQAKGYMQAGKGFGSMAMEFLG